MHHCTKGNAKNVLSKSNKRVVMELRQGADRARYEKSVITTQTRMHCFTFVQFKIISWNTKLIHSLYVFCTQFCNRRSSCTRSRTADRTARLPLLSTSSGHQEVPRARRKQCHTTTRPLLPQNSIVTFFYVFDLEIAWCMG